MTQVFDIDSEERMLALGQAFAAALTTPTSVHLTGDLGAGKTTFVRGVIQGLGCDDAVVSPTYTLVEEYLTPTGTAHHLDLYRIAQPDDVESLAIRDRFDSQSIVLIEWPERAADRLPEPQWRVQIAYADAGRRVGISARDGQRLDIHL